MLWKFTPFKWLAAIIPLAICTHQYCSSYLVSLQSRSVQWDTISVAAKLMARHQYSQNDHYWIMVRLISEHCGPWGDFRLGRLPCHVVLVFLVKLPWDECHWILPMISQHWFRQWLAVIRQQAIIWANVDPDLCCHMTSLGHNGLIYIMLYENWYLPHNFGIWYWIFSKLTCHDKLDI